MTTLARAKQLQEAFGPCTVAYECGTPQGIMDECNRDGERSWVVEALRVEQYQYEHGVNAMVEGGESTKEEIDRYRQEYRTMLDAVHQRLEDLSFKVAKRYR